MKITISEMKNTLERINSRLNEALDQISNLGEKVAENTQLEQWNKKRIYKNEDSLRGFWDNMKNKTSTSCGYQKEKKENKRSRTYLNK